MNFLYDDIVHALQNTIDSCINSSTYRHRGYVLESTDGRTHARTVYTALNVMQTRYRDENSVRLSVRPSVCHTRGL